MESSSRVFFNIQFCALLLAPSCVYINLRLVITSLYNFHRLRGYSSHLKARSRFVCTDLCQYMVIIWLSIGISISCSTTESVKSILWNKQRPLLLAGLSFQFLTFLFLLLSLSELCVRTRYSTGGQTFGAEAKLKLFMLTIWLSTVLLLLRTIFQLVETAGDTNTCSINRKEPFFGLFDYLPTVIAIWLLAVWHPETYPAVPMLEHGQTDWGGMNG